MPDIQLPARLDRRIAERRKRLDEQRPLAPSVVRSVRDDLRILLTYHSNAIEGNTLDESETQMVIEHGITIGGHTVKEHLEAINHAEAITLLYQLAERGSVITHADVLQLHALITAKLLPSAGQYRDGPVSIRGSRHIPPPWQRIPELMNIWLAWPDGEGLDYPPIVRAALAHEAFLNIHPFYDGNGRVARLLLNLQLMRDGYPTVLIQRSVRETYIRALEAAHFGNYQALVTLVGQAVDAGLSLWLDACERAPEDYKLPAREVAAASGMDAAYLSWLLRNQRVDGTKVGGRWYTSEAAVRRYRDEVARRVNPPGRPKRH
jgi:fido (protein-threonine AMPylation protein)